MDNNLLKLAKLVDNAALNAKAIAQLTLKHKFNVEEAYQIQALSMQQRYRRGEQQTGIKMGFTSHLKMQQMGVNEMIWGQLTDAMLVEENGNIDLSAYVHPRAEPEIAFLLKKPLSGIVSTSEAMSAVEAVAPAIEIIDSRYNNFKFSLEDVIADNSSSSSYVIGGWKKPNIDISNLGMAFTFNGSLVETGSSAAILGNPINSLVAASRLFGNKGRTLEPGWIVLAGAATAAVELRSNITVQNEVENLGLTSFNVN